jgi:hypothetical protein
MAVSETDKLGKTANITEIGNARAIIFDRRWDFGVNTTRGYVELRVLDSPQTQQFEFCWSVGIAGYIPLQYDVDVNGDTYRELNLPSDAKLYIDVANFRASRRQCAFDLLVELKPPAAAGSLVRIFNDTAHCAIPTTSMVEEQLRAQLPNINQLERALASVRALASTNN